MMRTQKIPRGLAPLLMGLLFALAASLFASCSIIGAGAQPTPQPTRVPTNTPAAPSNGQAVPPARSGTDVPTRAPHAVATDDDTVSSDIVPNVKTNDVKIPAGMSRVAGRVTDAQGNPIANAAVTVPKGTAPVPERAALTNENGEYVWGLPPGTYTIQVNAEGFKMAQAQVNAIADKQTEQNFTLEPE